MNTTQAGDYSRLARYYGNRPAYSPVLIEAIVGYAGLNHGTRPSVVEVGAGTGKLTRMLLERRMDVTAVEPNDAMRAEGIRYTDGMGVRWIGGTGEQTGLADGVADWVVMASSFHWTDPAKSLPEFSRILKPGGYLTVMWNPRDLDRSDLDRRIEARIAEIAPHIERRSSGAKRYTETMADTLVFTGHFAGVLFMEARHEERMTRERYLGIWMSVNDVRAQAGEEGWARILAAIEQELNGAGEVVIPYLTRAWTARKVG
jgi:ubiquinone/menaquinone biosynthesis C-methylase UbiE